MKLYLILIFSVFFLLLSPSCKTKSVVYKSKNPKTGNEITVTAPPASTNVEKPASFTLSEAGVFTYNYPKDNAPPSIAKQAEAATVKWYAIASIICLVVCALMTWRRHYWGAACFGGAAIGAPLLSKFFTNNLPFYITICLAVAGTIFMVSWHVMRVKGQLKEDVTA